MPRNLPLHSCISSSWGKNHMNKIALKATNHHQSRQTKILVHISYLHANQSLQYVHSLPEKESSSRLIKSPTFAYINTPLSHSQSTITLPHSMCDNHCKKCQNHLPLLALSLRHCFLLNTPLLCPLQSADWRLAARALHLPSGWDSVHSPSLPLRSPWQSSRQWAKGWWVWWGGLEGQA